MVVRSIRTLAGIVQIVTFQYFCKKCQQSTRLTGIEGSPDYIECIGCGLEMTSRDLELYSTEDHDDVMTDLIKRVTVLERGFKQLKRKKDDG